MKNKIGVYGCISLMVTGLMGCAGVTPEPNVALDDVRNVLSQTEIQPPDTMRIATKVDYVDGKNNKRVVGQDLVLSSQVPGKMRITISAFDKAVSTLVTDGSVFALMDVTQNVYLAGIASSENISQILPVSLSASDLFRVIHGGYPKNNIIQSNEQEYSIQWDGKAGGYRQSMPTTNGGIQDVYYAYPTWDIFKITVSHEDKLTYIYEASDFKEFTSNDKKYRYPGQIIFRLPQEDTNVRLRVESCDLNVEFSEAVFRLLPVAGAKILILDNLGEDQNDSSSENTETVENAEPVIEQDNSTSVTDTQTSEEQQTSADSSKNESVE